jgi:hypothetical protein
MQWLTAQCTRQNISSRQTFTFLQFSSKSRATERRLIASQSYATIMFRGYVHAVLATLTMGERRFENKETKAKTIAHVVRASRILANELYSSNHVQFVVVARIHIRVLRVNTRSRLFEDRIMSFGKFPVCAEIHDEESNCNVVRRSEIQRTT